MNYLFPVAKPVIAMVHLQYKGDINRLIGESLRDVDRLERGGADGLLFENWGSDYTERRVSRKTKEYVAAAIKEAAKSTRLPYGVNVLPLDYEADFDIAKATGARFAQIDTFVDRVVTDYRNRFVLQVQPEDIMAYRKRCSLGAVALFTNIQTKHYVMLPVNKRLETSASQAIAEGADALVVTGEWTGKKTPKEKLMQVKAVSGDCPVYIGSGFVVEDAHELLPYADGIIVGTSLKYSGVTENPVELARVQRTMDVVSKFR